MLLKVFMFLIVNDNAELRQKVRILFLKNCVPCFSTDVAHAGDYQERKISMIYVPSFDGCDESVLAVCKRLRELYPEALLFTSYKSGARSSYFIAKQLTDYLTLSPTVFIEMYDELSHQRFLNFMRGLDPLYAASVSLVFSPMKNFFFGRRFPATKIQRLILSYMIYQYPHSVDARGIIEACYPEGARPTEDTIYKYVCLINQNASKCLRKQKVKPIMISSSRRYLLFSPNDAPINNPFNRRKKSQNGFFNIKK